MQNWYIIKYFLQVYETSNFMAPHVSALYKTNGISTLLLLRFC